MRHQAIRTTALMLGVLLAAAAPAQAGTITFGDLVRTVGANGQLRPASEVRLRLGAQAGSTAAQSGSTQNGTTSSAPDQQAAGSQPSAPSGTWGRHASTVGRVRCGRGHVRCPRAAATPPTHVAGKVAELLRPYYWIRVQVALHALETNRPAHLQIGRGFRRPR